MDSLMTVVVVSDNHGDRKILNNIRQAYPSCASYLHCGDSEMSLDELAGWQVVIGNNDRGLMAPKAFVCSLGQARILVLHSHTLGYGNRDQKMVDLAKKLDCSIVCYGHTHVFDCRTIDGVTLCNPGSLFYNRDRTDPCFGILRLDPRNQAFVSFDRVPRSTVED